MIHVHVCVCVCDEHCEHEYIVYIIDCVMYVHKTSVRHGLNHPGNELPHESMFPHVPVFLKNNILFDFPG